MEIYYRRVPWLGFVFLTPALWMSLSLAGYTPFKINGSEAIAAFVVIGVCFLVALQCFLGSTRFYFDNEAKAGIQIRKHFYGEKIFHHPYSSIVSVSTRCYRRGTSEESRYCVGIVENESLYGQSATKFIELRSFGCKAEDRSVAQDLAKQISSYTNLNFIDDSDLIRPELEYYDHS